MIRDPSDGSVKTPEKWETVEQLQAEVARQDPKAGFSEKDMAAVRAAAGPKSGLPPIESDQLNRLQRSREWLKTYRTNPEAVMRKMGETE